MHCRIIHFYPDLMNLYGSYANLSVLQRYLELLGHTVCVETVAPGAGAELSGADFLFMGAGTERSQKAALADFRRFADDIRTLAQEGVPMLFCGTAMELLGKSITDEAGTVHEGLALADFTSVQSARRQVIDVYGHTDLFPEAVVGFLNKSSVISGVTTPLLRDCALGWGNEKDGGGEGVLMGSVMGSHLTGPLLVKNPRLLEHVVRTVCSRRGEALPESLPRIPHMEESYLAAEQQLRLRSEK